MISKGREIMLRKKKEEYLTLRNAFAPKPVRLAIIAESPPKSGLYFYNPNGKVTEPLFAAMMEHLRSEPRTKDEGLREFQRHGWVLVDATYEPVDGPTDTKRDQVILRDYPLLRADLTAMLPGQSVPIILVKANVCRLLEPRLREDGFNVLNAGAEVYFPSSGQQNKFREQFGAILKSLAVRG
jgi:hypothetical protein